jgi:hypothetical protein
MIASSVGAKAGADSRKETKKEVSEAASFLEEQMQKYKPRGQTRKGDREGETMAILSRFQEKLLSAVKSKEEPQPAEASGETSAKGGGKKDDNDDEDDDDDTDVRGIAWLRHAFVDEGEVKPKGIDPEKDRNALDLNDPRHPLNERRRENNTVGRKHECDHSSSSHRHHGSSRRSGDRDRRR